MAVYCFNRRPSATMIPVRRQMQTLEGTGIVLDAPTMSKFRMLEGDTTKPSLGLVEEQYNELLGDITHIVHAQWLMSGKRPVKDFESLFNSIGNLVSLI
jgi:thioester reductase-like protein